MFNYLKKIDTENIPVIRALVCGTMVMLSYILFVWLIRLANPDFVILALILSLIAIFCSTAAIFTEDKMTINDGENSKMPAIRLYSLASFIIFWSLILLICQIIHINNFTFYIIALSGIFSFIKLISAHVILPKLMKSLKKAKKIREDYENKTVDFINSMINIDSENKLLRKLLLKAFIFSFFPALISIVFLWWGGYNIIVAMQVPFQLKLYIIFVIVFEIILTNFSRVLKKSLIDNIIKGEKNA